MENTNHAFEQLMWMVSGILPPVVPGTLAAKRLPSFSLQPGRVLLTTNFQAAYS
jgi:hypothetical protein